MADEKSARARRVYDTLNATLDALEWKHTRDDEQLTIECVARGDDLPMEIEVNIDTDRQLIILLSQLPIVVPEEKRLDTAIAATIVNNKLADGSFDFNIKDGHMFFRMTSSFIESDIGSELLEYMLFCSCQTIDDFNDKFVMLGKGLLSIENFILDN